MYGYELHSRILDTCGDIIFVDLTLRIISKDMLSCQYEYKSCHQPTDAEVLTCVGKNPPKRGPQRGTLLLHHLLVSQEVGLIVLAKAEDRESRKTGEQNGCIIASHLFSFCCRIGVLYFSPATRLQAD